MAALAFLPLPTDTAEGYRSGAPDANGQPPERHISDGHGNPCRHCLREIPAGAPMLILAHRPFTRAQPYAEIGPIFLCADPCPAYEGDGHLPPMFAGWDRLLMRGYGTDERIVYGSGRIVETGEIEAESTALLADPRIAFLHLRSASNNCYQARIERR